mmetsp:Transcript_4928/g.16421  ORF Transcript_4928/g.16421 Transcript_4928/m.16421 type:complete len:282 (+) Transcript_4928:2450-3295(+)
MNQLLTSTCDNNRPMIRLAFIARSNFSILRNLIALRNGVLEDSTTWSNGNSETTSMTKYDRRYRSRIFGKDVTTFWVSLSTYPSTNCTNRSMTKKPSISRFITINARCVAFMASHARFVYDTTNAASYGSRKIIVNSKSIMNPSQYITYHAWGRITTSIPKHFDSGSFASRPPALRDDDDPSSPFHPFPSAAPLTRATIVGSSKRCASSGLNSAAFFAAARRSFSKRSSRATMEWLDGGVPFFPGTFFRGANVASSPESNASKPSISYDTFRASLLCLGGF